MTANVIGEQLSQQEIDAYVAYSKEKYPNRAIKSLTIKADGEFVDLILSLRMFLLTGLEELPDILWERLTGLMTVSVLRLKTELSMGCKCV